MKSPLFFLNTDVKILDMMKQGDEQALVMLYDANRRMVTSYTLRNGGTEDDAEDLLQDAVIVLWERVRSGRFEYSSKLSTFLYATVQNMWRRRRAKLIRETPTDMSGDEGGESGDSPLDDLMQTELSAAIAAAVVKLGEPCRTLLVLFYWEERSLQEIALQMHFANTDTVKSKKYQCKKSLEKILSDERIL
jgi:RNA polymerase sigma factor (sigma-70 family)